MLYFRILSQDMNCVAAIGVVHFSVRGFGCALFYFRKEYKNMKVKKYLAVATAVALVISLTACTGSEQVSSADKSTSDITDSVPSSVDESSDTATQSKEETTASTESTTAATTSATSVEESSDTVTQSKEETTAGTESTTAATTPAASVEESSDTVTESKAETPASTADTTAEIPATEAPATTKAETIAPTLSKNERYVYDEDGNVVDKIKVKVVDGVTYTVGTDNKEHYIKDNVALIPNDPKFVSGDGIACLQIKLKYYGVDMTQEEVAKYFTYCSPDDWYVGEDGRHYGPWVDSYFEDPTKEKTMNFIDVTASGITEALIKIIEDKNVTNINEYIGTQFRDETNIRDDNLYITTVIFSDKPIEYWWFYLNDDGTTSQVKFEHETKNAILIGYSGEDYYYYFPGSNKIIVNSNKEGLCMV